MQSKPFRYLGVAVLMMSLSTGCAVFKKTPPPDRYTREVARHAENTGEIDVVTRVFEEREDGVYSVRIQVIREGKVNETVHYLDDDSFIISVPVSAHIQVQNIAEAAKADDTGVFQFTQNLEMAREAMLRTDYIKALEAVNAALRIDHYNPQAHMMKGSIFYAMGRYDLARKEFDYVLELEPDNIEVKQFREFMEAEGDGSGRVKIEGSVNQ
jgi:tetratricopeptide (TPR) repeat protein